MTKILSISSGIAALCLSVLAINQHGRLAAAATLGVKQRSEIAQLQQQFLALQQENAALKNTADFFYQRGVELQSAQQLNEAKEAFGTVVSKFPASKTAEFAKQRLTDIDNLIAKAETDKLAEARSRQEEQERATREQGEQIDFDYFHAKAHTVGLPVGKRFRFRAKISSTLFLSNGDSMEWGVAAFDDPTEQEKILRIKGKEEHEIVASMSSNGEIMIHKVQ